MAHWEHRSDEKWKDFEFNQPYAKGRERLMRDVLGKTDFDPVTLWQWGTMQASALIQLLRDCEAKFGEEGQRLVFGALHKTGLDVGRQILAGTTRPDGISDAEFISFYATVINRIAYASLEVPRIDSSEKVTFDIVWCPHQDHYGAFDCRVQRYFVQGMIDAAKEFLGTLDFEVRFDTTIPAGAPTCHFTLWKPTESQRAEWQKYTEALEKKALERARAGK